MNTTTHFGAKLILACAIILACFGASTAFGLHGKPDPRKSYTEIREFAKAIETALWTCSGNGGCVSGLNFGRAVGKGPSAGIQTGNIFTVLPLPQASTEVIDAEATTVQTSGNNIFVILFPRTSEKTGLNRADNMIIHGQILGDGRIVFVHTGGCMARAEGVFC